MPQRIPAALAAIAMISASGAAAAQTAAPAPQRADAVQRVVYICASDAATTRAFEREYGEAPTFMTAEAMLAAASSGEAWSAPRCMTDAQHARFERMRAQSAQRTDRP